MFEVTFVSAFLGGLLTFFASCTFPLIPGYIAFIGGEKEREGFRRRILWNALLFVLGFSLVFIVYGITSGALGKFLVLYRPIIAQVGGFIVLALGLSMLDLFSFFRLPAFSGTRHLPGGIVAGSSLGAFLLGLIFALGWSPCLGPVLGTILLLASVQETALSGGLLLGVYSFGLALPFLLVAFFYGSTFAYVPRFMRYLPVINKIGGALLMCIGLLLIFGQFGILNTWVGEMLGPRFLDVMVQHT